MVVQWLRLCTSTAGGVGLIPGQGTKLLHAIRHGQKINLKIKKKLPLKFLFVLISFLESKINI